jgi:hypothetical protein
MGFAMETLLQKPEVKRAFGKKSSSDPRWQRKRRDLDNGNNFWVSKL